MALFCSESVAQQEVARDFLDFASAGARVNTNKG
jgi:hypothetical protein